MEIFTQGDLKRIIKRSEGIKLKLPEKLKTRYLTFGISEISPGERTQEHNHAVGEEFILTIEGKGTIFLDKKEYSLKKGDIVFIKEKASHQVVNTGGEILQLLFVVSPPLDF